MTPSYDAVAHLPLAVRQRVIGRADTDGEDRLLLPLLRWLTATRRINERTRVVLELPWLGRRVDLATMTSTRRTAAYELKLASLGRALEQAAYNRLAFDRSYVVTASAPRQQNVELARESGIGILLVRDDAIWPVLGSPALPATPILRARLLSKLAVADV